MYCKFATDVPDEFLGAKLLQQVLNDGKVDRSLQNGRYVLGQLDRVDGKRRSNAELGEEFSFHGGVLEGRGRGDWLGRGLKSGGR